MAIGVFLCPLFSLLPNTLHALTDVNDYQPFETRDQNILNLIHGQALPTNAYLLKKNETRWSNSLSITNTLTIQANTDETIHLDYEAYRFNLSLQHGIDKNWNLKLDLPIIYQSGGFLDSAIDNWHDFFGLPHGNRPFVDNNQYTINYTFQDQALSSASKDSTTLGDLQIAAAHSLIENDNTTMSMWTSLKLPTGDKNKLSGNGAIDISAWLALNQKLTTDWLLNINAGGVILGTDDYQNIPVSDYVIYGHIMLGWLLTDSINLKVQLQGHTSYYDQSQLKILGSTYFLSFGGTIKINRCQQLDIAMNEDVKVDASPDASLLITWRSNSLLC